MLGVRVRPELLARIDAHLEHIYETDGYQLSRADLVRKFIEDGLAAAESSKGTKRKKKP